jgi:hypothetical protein
MKNAGEVTEQEEREQDFVPLSGALTSPCEKRFGLAFHVGGKPLLHIFGCRLGFALDHPVIISSITYSGMSWK